jgi:hypothetical protein
MLNETFNKGNINGVQSKCYLLLNKNQLSILLLIMGHTATGNQDNPDKHTTVDRAYDFCMVFNGHDTVYARQGLGPVTFLLGMTVHPITADAAF